MELETYPNPVLRTSAFPVKNVGRRETGMLRKMLVNMRRWQGVGLAAPQVGCLDQLIVAEAGGQTILWANPVIVERNGAEKSKEGCLSLPGKTVEVCRSFCIWVQAINEANRKVECKLEGLLARIIQHEIDHLHGVLILDYGSPSCFWGEGMKGELE